MGEKKEDAWKRWSKGNYTVRENIIFSCIVIFFIGIIYIFFLGGKEKIFDLSLRYDNWKLDKARSKLICSKKSGTANSDFAAAEMYKACMKDRKNRGHH